MVDCHPSESIVNLGSASVDNVSSGWQSTLLPNALFKSMLHIFDCYTIILQLLGERRTVKTIDRWIVHYWLVMWQMTSRNVKSPDVNDEYRRIVDSVSLI